ncbi:MAG: site-specific integrase [Firmicutes bacterium]|nr:site-specific integrase [Bacillota bacterium]
MQLKRLRIIQDSNCSITSLFERFLLTKQAEGVKTKTLLTYSQHLRAMSYHLDTSLDISEMNKNKYEQMIASMVNSRLSPNSIRSYSITLKAFLSWCNDEGYTNFNIKTYKGVETVKETYTDQELNLLLEKPNMRNTTFAEYRTWVIINLLVNNGCRASTIRNIKIWQRKAIISSTTCRSATAPPSKKGWKISGTSCRTMKSGLRWTTGRRSC